MTPAEPAGSSVAADPRAPYVRLAVVALIRRVDGVQQGRAVGGAAAAAVAPHWLLLHRTQPFDAWDPPGGRMEVGEDLVEAVTREVKEETGLAVDVAGPCYGYLTFYKGERLLAVSMACRPAGDPDAIRLDPDDAEGWRWATLAEWEALAERGLSSWDPKDVRKATKAVVAVWEAEEA
jgi:8-oxo-dGTP pyrophosphatase MutT (NUDIX family)